MAEDARTGLPRAAVEEFFRKGIEMMESDATRELLKDKALPKRPGMMLVELQRSNWEPMGVDPDFGCAALDNLEQLYPDLVELKLQFAQTAMRMYMQALEDRKPEVLEEKEKMPRLTILEFFDACNTKMDLPGTQESMLQHMATTKQVPNQIIIEMQRDMLETLGFEREHGCACLSAIPQDFPSDQELHERFAVWQRKAQQTCMMVVQQHKQKGGEMPQDVQQHPDLARLQAQARESLEQMTPTERGEMVQRMSKKVQVFMNLPPAGREQYIKRLSEAEKLEFVKGQMLVVSVMQQQRFQQGGQQAQHPLQAEGADAAPAPVTAKPSQQQMM